MSKKYFIKRDIIKCLILAFVASSGGKHNEDVWGDYVAPYEGGVCEKHLRSWKAGYSEKDKLLLSAIEKIDNSKYCGIKYSVDVKGDHRAPIIVNFLVKNGKDEIFLSFHSFNKKSLSLYAKDKNRIRYREYSGYGTQAVKQLEKLLKTA